MLGQTLSEIIEHVDQITFKTAAGDTWEMYHSQDCCESITIDDIAGDLEDLIGHPLLQAEEVSTQNLQDLPLPDVTWLTLTNQMDSWHGESETWTFYKFATIKGSVTIRWYGASNGYYSESVTLIKN